MKNYDLIVIGAGPAGIFLCLEFKKYNKEAKVLLIEQGKRIDKRICPVSLGSKCVHCKPYCNITCGFSGAGAFSDGKLSLYNEEDDDIYVGGNIHKYIGVEKTKELIDYADKMYLKFGAGIELEGTEYKEKIKEYKEKAKSVDTELISIPIRHLGTEKAHEVYKRMEQELIRSGVILVTETTVNDFLIEEGVVKGVFATSNQKEETYFAGKVAVCVGRKGASWLFDMCEKHKISSHPGIVDIGVRYELKDEVMKDINKIMYEAKFVSRSSPYKDRVRTFCQNPSGFVSAEVYEDGLTLVNGHSYKLKKSTNTNLAILCSHHFTEPFKDPILYGKNIAKNANLLSNGQVLVQRYGDILLNHRTKKPELENNSVIPTLGAAEAGDITLAIGYRTMTSILDFIERIDKVVPGFAGKDNLLYAPEIKFYSNEIDINYNFETSIKGLFSIGDAGGLTRGLMQASISGIYLARILT